MTKRDFLFLLFFIKGIGIVGRYRIWEFIEKYHIQQFPLSEKQLSMIMGKQIHIPTVSSKLLRQYQNWPHIMLNDTAYPSLLRQIPSPPVILFYMGDLRLLQHYMLSIVGTRQMTSYAEGILKAWIPPVCLANIVTVSGLAHGVDGLVHELTLQCGGKTIGIIGTGIDIAYPKRQQTQLQMQIGKRGLLLSEYLPGTGPRRHHFPERNRLIAGVTQRLLVVEAKRRSGSLITAQCALDYNRDVLAIPGRIDQSQSLGTNQLIVEGAEPVHSVIELLNKFKEPDIF